MERKEKNKILSDIAVNACNSIIDSIFSNNNYEKLHPAEKIRISCLLLKTNKLKTRYQA